MSLFRRWRVRKISRSDSPTLTILFIQQDVIHSVIGLVNSAWQHEFLTCVVISPLQI
jgi:hypothetical protein